MTDEQLSDRGYVTALLEKAILAETYRDAVVDVFGDAGVIMGKNLLAAGHEAAKADDHETAFEAFLAAAVLGSPDGMFFTGRSYQTGTGVGRCARSAMRWLERSANRDFAGAMSALGDVYYRGDGCKPSPSVAFGWYSKAVAKGNQWPLERMGEMVAAGLGTEALPEKAADFLTKARAFYQSQAEINAWACYRLGVMTRDGVGGPADYDAGWESIAQAARHGLQDAIDALAASQDAPTPPEARRSQRA